MVRSTVHSEAKSLGGHGEIPPNSEVQSQQLTVTGLCAHHWLVVMYMYAVYHLNFTKLKFLR